ncbi:MAG: hypothetical protein AABW56_04430 [Nanoarchaeota archaeon]|mgnify:CR=1 FL=1
MSPIKYVTRDELMKDAVPSNAFEEARKTYLAAIEAEGPIDRVAQRQLEDWNHYYRYGGFCSSI